MLSTHFHHIFSIKNTSDEVKETERGIAWLWHFFHFLILQYLIVVLIIQGIKNDVNHKMTAIIKMLEKPVSYET